MKTIDVIALLLVIIGGLNWGFVGLANYNFVDAIFGVNTTVTNVIYVLVGIAALWTLSILSRTITRRPIAATTRTAERTHIAKEEAPRETVPPSERVRQ